MLKQRETLRPRIGTSSKRTLTSSDARRHTLNGLAFKATLRDGIVAMCDELESDPPSRFWIEDLKEGRDKLTSVDKYGRAISLLLSEPGALPCSVDRNVLIPLSDLINTLRARPTLSLAEAWRNETVTQAAADVAVQKALVTQEARDIIAAYKATTAHHIAVITLERVLFDMQMQCRIAGSVFA